MVEKGILVTGGAGYIGSHLVKDLLEDGYRVIALDNLSSGFFEPIEILKKNYQFDFIKCDLADKEKLNEIFHKEQIEAVIHLAAKIDILESIKNPNLYHRENYVNSINLIEAMMAAHVKNCIFSSTAAVYGNPKYIPIDERHPTNPTNPYGQTKLDFEKYLSKLENPNYVILRYFNVGGSDPNGLIGKSHLKSQDLIENIIKVNLGQKKFIEIFGNNYDTRDGTAIRDFVHVEDIAQAHILALEKIEKSAKEIFNLGSEQGFSVKEIIDQANSIFGKEIPVRAAGPREGDIAVSVASAQKAKKILGWNPKYSNLDLILQTDWNWRKNHPLGYNENKASFK